MRWASSSVASRWDFTPWTLSPKPPSGTGPRGQPARCAAPAAEAALSDTGRRHVGRWLASPTSCCLHGPGSNGLLPSATDAWAGRGNPCAEAAAEADGPPTRQPDQSERGRQRPRTDKTVPRGRLRDTCRRLRSRAGLVLELPSKGRLRKRFGGIQASTA